MPAPEDSSLTSATEAARVLQVRGAEAREVDDALVVEEPLEIRISGRAFSVTMRTPGQDDDLVRGLLWTEGIVRLKSEIGAIQYCRSADMEEDEANTMNAQLVGVEVAERMWQRNLMAGSSCGLCGKATIEALAAQIEPVTWDTPVTRTVLAGLPEKLRGAQAVFERTGGLHAAGVFDFAGQALAICEDIGRHNATDKAIGRGLEEGWIAAREPLILMVSGRASFEIVQKALMARISVVAAVSAASHLAVELARENNILLAGFVRQGSLTVYSGQERMLLDQTSK